MWSKVERREIIIIRGRGISVQEVSRGRLAGTSDAPRGREIQAGQGAERGRVGRSQCSTGLPSPQASFCDPGCRARGGKCISH